MARFPSPFQVAGPASMRPAGGPAIEDVSGLIGGVQDLASGLRHAAGSIATIEQKDRQRKNVAELAAADATWTKSALELGNSFDARGDYENFHDEGNAETARLMQEAAGRITDPEMRERWLREAEQKRIHVADNITDLGRVRLQEKDRATLDEALAANSDLIADPSIYAPLRDKARADIEGSIDMAEASGLITPAEGQKQRDFYLRGADERLAENYVLFDIATGDPRQVQDRLGITPGAMGGANVAGAAISAAGGAVALTPEVAALAAEAIGDTALPSDAGLREAYLRDPEMNQRYVTAAVDVLTRRYRGDLSAAVIATQGGLALADRWVKSNHDESVLPTKVRDQYRKTMAGMVVEPSLQRLPIVAADDVNVADVDVGVLDRWEQVQSVFGKQLPVISGHRDPERNAAVGGADGSQHLHGRAIDISVKGLGKEEVIRLIETASAMGFTGIGVYDNSLHLDAGSRRAWGPSYGRESVPAWAEEAIGRHLTGAVTEPPIAARGVDPRYAALSFDKRLKLWADAKRAADSQELDMRAGIELAVQNAPAAIASLGEYNRTLPTADDFVEAYGAAEGIERYKAFDASVDVAQTSYSMRTMSAEEIAAAVESAVPTSGGDMAEVEAKRFEAVQQAAAAIFKQREEDPAGYVVAVMPNVAAAWEAVKDDPGAMQQALTMTAEAQEQLGFDELRLLPKALAAQSAGVFNDPERPQAERQMALTQLVFSSNVEEHQEAILDQLVEAGVPPHLRGAVAALERGDNGAAGYLFRAAMTDPNELKINTDDSKAQINRDIWEKLFSENAIGDVTYGISDGTAENFTRVAADRTLIERAVMMRLADGSASSTEQAIDMTARDMFGDVRVVTGKSWGGGAGLKITLPGEEPEGPMRDGFNALLGGVADAAMANLTRQIASALPAGDSILPVRDNAQSGYAIATAARDMEVTKIIEEGFFANYGKDAYVFVEPETGMAIPDPMSGEPMTFTREQVLAAGAETASSSYAGTGRPNPMAAQ